MKINEQWLREWVDPNKTVEEIAAQITMAGLEVDALTPVAPRFENVVVAEVIKTSPHPQADKLTLCEVDDGSGKCIPIVCGAANVRQGIKVALAKLGAVLPGDFHIKEAKLRGEVSQGMLCSASELGLAEQSEGIMELEDDAPLGTSIREYFELEDVVIDVDLTPNRADCFSVLGIAREVGALNELPIKEPTHNDIAPQIDEQLTVNLKEPTGCPHYIGRIIKDINAQATTPLWMKEKLRRCGIRCLHPVVDVTNYVMLELGQPMHAFDLHALDGSISVRLAKDNEALELLDGQEVTLNPEVLVIADEKKALAMAGVMGGAGSAVGEDTKDIFLESAYFNPKIISGVARKYGLFTDSSQRYERGVDPNMQLIAMERATELLQSIVGGQAGPLSRQKNNENFPRPKQFRFRLNRVKQLTGVELSEDKIKTLLKSLEINIKDVNEGEIEVNIPSHRFDLSIEEDLVEEVIRLYGYDKLHSEGNMIEMQAGQLSRNEFLNKSLASWFQQRGYHETISYSFVDPELQSAIYPDKNSIELLNPISAELSEMRKGLWPGLIASMIYNAHRQHHAMKLFELGVVFDKENDKIIETPKVAALLMGEQGSLNWSETNHRFDFYDLKGDMESLLSHFHMVDAKFESGSHPALHPGKTAKIIVNGDEKGYIGVLHPKITQALDMTQDVILAEINLDAFDIDIQTKYQKISKFPQIRRDLSFLVKQDVSVSAIKDCILTSNHQGWLKQVDFFDLYNGQGIPEGKKSLALAMTLQDTSKTLVDSEINQLISAIIKSLEKNFAITLRD